MNDNLNYRVTLDISVPRAAYDARRAELIAAGVDVDETFDADLVNGMLCAHLNLAHVLGGETQELDNGVEASLPNLGDGVDETITTRDSVMRVRVAKQEPQS